MNKKIELILILLFAVPVVGVLLGGVYSLPAMYVTKSRDPAYTILLGFGLSATVLVVGLIGGLQLAVIASAWLIACVALVIRRCFGKLDHNVERFGFVHVFSLLGMMWIVLITRRVGQ